MLHPNGENIDPVTGQPYFRPQTGRSPRGIQRDAGPSKVGKHLYQQAMAQKERQERVKREEMMRQTEKRRQIH
jgi:hypothetical protein